ncbi:Predicted arabinose efflux permease, MFS family [Polaribacter sp. Hel1_33_78]|jgi:predicted MFS family arabinose efflux permease|uniref:MDR family MFS transporter n=1 Tax=Polaribacter sp. Hel1_33_78 TaxID=1336804 RepID=UPI00087C8CE0|nr:MFS transporter [Polaribacter sp. Hel1_33_78]SDT93812.1 Predicted arabinose efflux permease, MFS family [Polaribacter sp. Hel1_33_78]
MRKLYNNYISTFRGLSVEVWWLSLITFINRSGTMVIPFLSLYLNKSLNISLPDIGWIMSFFGLGSVIGAWLGGKLTDKIGYYKVMLGSLFLTGILFILLQFITTFEGFCAGIFIVMLVADAFRPAMFVALSAYSKPENKTRSVTLIRLAINLGFSAGPAIGGLIITGLGYQGLFWVDGVTCSLAAILLLQVLHPKKSKIQDEVKVDNPVSAYSDKAFWVFFIAMFIFGFVFLQYFSTMPLYYKDVHFLSELEIGLLMGFNGFFIFLFEMPLIKWLEDSKYSKVKLIAIGLFLVALSFVVVTLTSWLGILIVGMFLMTVGEMIAFPFSNAFAVERAKKGNQGEYMALYAIAFSIAHIFSHNTGMQMISKFGYKFTWNVMTILAMVGVLILFLLMTFLKKEKDLKGKID